MCLYSGQTQLICCFSDLCKTYFRGIKMSFMERKTPQQGKLTQTKGSCTKVNSHRFKIPWHCTPSPLWGTCLHRIIDWVLVIAEYLPAQKTAGCLDGQTNECLRYHSKIKGQTCKKLLKNVRILGKIVSYLILYVHFIYSFIYSSQIIQRNNISTEFGFRY